MSSLLKWIVCLPKVKIKTIWISRTAVWKISHNILEQLLLKVENLKLACKQENQIKCQSNGDVHTGSVWVGVDQ